MAVGWPNRPTCAGNGGLLRGSARFPSIELISAVFLARDVGTGAPPDLDVEREALAHHVGAEETAGAGLPDGMPQPRLRQRVLAPGCRCSPAPPRSSSP